MMALKQRIKDNPIMTSFILLYLLPPVGMACFVALGIYEICRSIKYKIPIPHNLMSLFFIVLFFSSLGATLSDYYLVDLVSPAIIVCFFGIYLCIARNSGVLRLKNYIWVSIFGGLYIYFFGKLLNGIPLSTLPGKCFGLLTGGMLLGYNHHDRLYGSAYNPNYASYLLVLAIAFLLAELLQAIKKGAEKQIAFSLLLLALLSFGVFDTGSRAGFISMLTLYGLFLLRMDKRAFIIVLGLCAANWHAIFAMMPRNSGTEISFATRLDIWKNSFYIFLQHPMFGVTPLGFNPAYIQLTGEEMPHPHNIFLSFYSIFGFFSGTLFIIIVVWNGYKLLKLLQAAGDNGGHGHRYDDLFLFSMPTLIISGLFDFPLSSPQIAITIIALMCLWSSYLKHVKTEIAIRSILFPLAIEPPEITRKPHVIK